MTKGSIWRIWDFHLHSPCSVLNNQFGDPGDEATWDKYILQIEEAASEKNVVAIAITDYFMIGGYKKAVQYQEGGKLQDVLLLPNIEFRVDRVVYRGRETSQPRRLNLHVLFSPSVTPEEIEEDFLHDLDFVYEKDPFDEDSKRKLKVRNLEAFGAQLKSQHPPFQSYGDLYVGCLNAIVRVEQIQETLFNRFRGEYIIVLDEQDLSLLNWDSQHHAVRKHLLQMSHAVYSSNPNTREFCLGRKHDSPEAYLDEFKSFKPCIWGCDSHGYDERFLEPKDSDGYTRYCWVKADVNWEGLKQILFEPEDRVRIQEISPEPDKSIYTLDKISVEETEVNDSLKIDATDIDLNPNLVALIGGRGSGKTALLDLVAACFREGGKLSNIEPSFFYRLYSNSNIEADSSNQPIPISLSFNSGEAFQKYVGQDWEVFEKADVIYLTQNHFDEYSANPNKLNGHIIDLVFEEYIDERREYEALEREIERKQRRIATVNLEIEQLRSEVEEKSELERDLSKRQGEVEDYADRIQRVESRQKTPSEEAESLTAEISSLRRENLLIESLQSRLRELRSRLEDFREEYHGQVAFLNEGLSSVFGSDYSTQFLPDIEGLNRLEAIIQMNESNLGDRKQTNTAKIEDLDNKVDDLEGATKVIAELRQSMDLIAEEMDSIRERIKDIEENEEKISQLEAQRVRLYTAMVCGIVECKEFLQDMIVKFEEGKSAILSNLEFSATVELDEDTMIYSLNARIDSRMVSERSLRQKLQQVFQGLKEVVSQNECEEGDLSDLIEQLKALAQDLYGCKLKATTYCEFYSAVFSKILGIGLKIKFNDKALNDLSMGERAIVLLKVLLALGDCPLIIDQPEEHLDNRYIYTELKPAFRQAKTRRQVIIATHNANLVVNTDAEQVIVAECVDGALSYRVGTLEDLQMRCEFITTILEGGEEAFEKREEKYGYRF